MNLKREMAQCVGLAVGWLILVLACYSPQSLTQDQTAHTQADAIRTARDLDNLAPDASPAVRPALIEASRALQDCAAELRTQGRKLDEAVKAGNQCKAEYEVQAAKLEKLQEDTGPLAWITDKFGRVGNAVFWFVMGGVFGGFVFRVVQALLSRVPV